MANEHKHTDPRTRGRKRRAARVRKRVEGSAARPRLSVFRSSRHIVAQVIDDSAGVTLAAASTMEADLRAASGDKSEKAKMVGVLVAERAKKAGVSDVVFDRAGNQSFVAVPLGDA